MLFKYKRVLNDVTSNMDGDDIYKATNCLMPCVYMEYKVSSHFTLKQETRPKRLLDAI